MTRRVAVALLGVFAPALGAKTGKDHPTLPSRWSATTIEPQAGLGNESYLFEAAPSDDTPSAMWSNYSGCERLIYVTSANGGTRYLLGCDALDCCHEPQDGNQIEFQIPNVHFANPNKTVEVSYQRANVTNFGVTVEVDEWSWEWAPAPHLSQAWKAHTVDCDSCVNGVRLVQWSSSAMGGEWYAIQFDGYKGYDGATAEGQQFDLTFQIPEVCRGNILACDGSGHETATASPSSREADPMVTAGPPFLGSTCTGPGESCCEAPGDDVENCPASARTDDCDAQKACCCG